MANRASNSELFPSQKRFWIGLDAEVLSCIKQSNEKSGYIPHLQ